MCEKSRNTNVHPLQDWHSWCRLCAKEDEQTINIFLKGRNNITESKDYDHRRLAISIHKYFEVEVRADEHLPLQLCTKCYFLLESLRKFNKRVIKVQKMYNVLHQVSENTEQTDIDALRLVYGVFEEDRPHDFINLPLADTKLSEEEMCITENEITCHIEIKEEEAINEFTSFTYDNVLDFENNSNEDPLDNNIDSLNGTDTICENTKGDCGETNDEIASEEKSSESRSLKITSAKDTEYKDHSEQEKPFTCAKCSMGFQIFSCYQRHMKSIHAEPDVESHFTTHLNLYPRYKHLPKGEKRNYPCPYCGQILLARAALRRHVRFVHMKERSFVCEECGKAVQTKYSLEQHMLTHTDVKPFECEVCKGCFKSHVRLKKHMQRHDPNTYTCKECGKKLSNLDTLNSHMLVHSDKTPHKCDYCGCVFKRRKDLKNHLIIHAGLRPYSCEFCNKTFTNKSNYRAHQRRLHPEEFAVLKASGEEISPKNIPTLAVLKALAKTAENLLPVRKKSKLPLSTIDAAASTSSTTTETNNELQYSNNGETRKFS